MAERALDLRGIGLVFIGVALVLGVGFVGGYSAGQEGPLVTVHGEMSNSSVSVPLDTAANASTPPGASP